MSSRLLDAELEELKELRLATEKTNSPLSVQVNSLLDEDQLKAYLKQLSGHLQSANHMVASSIFIKRYAFVPVIFLYAMSAWNRKLDISFSNISIESDEQKGLWLPKFYFKDFQSEETGADRDEWRRKCLAALFQDHLSPLINHVSRTAKVSKLILWENIAIYLFWLYETVLIKEGTSEEVKARANKDFQYLIFEAPGSLFGDYHNNPLVKYYNERVFLQNAQKSIRPRNTCCLAYLTKGQKHCSSCPHNCRR